MLLHANSFGSLTFSPTHIIRVDSEHSRLDREQVVEVDGSNDLTQLDLNLIEVRIKL